MNVTVMSLPSRSIVALAALSPLPVPGRVAGGVLVVAACLWRPPLVPDGVARLTILDVGQGLSVVIETRGHTLVYDAGPSFRTGSDTGQLVVVPFLRSRGIRTVDRVVVSHDDAFLTRLGIDRWLELTEDGLAEVAGPGTEGIPPTDEEVV